MKIKIENFTAVYDSPAVLITELESASVLCASSTELQNLQKESFDFDWEN